MSPPADNSGVRFPPPLFYVLALAGGYALQKRWPMPTLPGPPGAVRAAGILLALAGAAVAASAVRTFVRAGTSPNPTRPTAALALNGPYRFTRNPMYLGLAIASAGVAVVFDAIWPLVLIPVAVLLVTRFVIMREERYLEAKFGDAYRQYRARVRRWV